MFPTSTRRAFDLWKNAAGPRLQRLLEPARGEAVARRAVLLLVCFRQVRRDDVEEDSLQARVREMRGDARAHDTGPDDAHATNRVVHDGWLFRAISSRAQDERPCRFGVPLFWGSPLEMTSRSVVAAGLALLLVPFAA